MTADDYLSTTDLANE